MFYDVNEVETVKLIRLIKKIKNKNGFLMKNLRWTVKFHSIR